MIQVPLEVYRIDMKYIRNLHNIDDRVLSVSPQIGKDERPFLGVIIICNEHKYCVPLSKPKKKHEKMDKVVLYCINCKHNDGYYYRMSNKYIGGNHARNIGRKYILGE